MTPTDTPAEAAIRAKFEHFKHCRRCNAWHGGICAEAWRLWGVAYQLGEPAHQEAGR